MKKIILALFAIVVLCAMCKNQEHQEKRFQEIKKAEQEIVSKDYNVTLEEKQKLMDLYVSYVNDFPKDSLAPELLLRCAGIANIAQQEMYAITLYKRIFDEYPESELRPYALMEQALAYDNMGDVEHARPLYEQFLVEFSDHPYAGDIENLLEILGKSPEEIEFFKNQMEKINIGEKEESVQ